MLPNKHKDEWFVIDGLDEIFHGMALYHVKDDEFYSVFSVENYTVYLENLTTGESDSGQKQQINEQLYDKWLPVEVKA